jgi:hypothetical protein
MSRFKKLLLALLVLLVLSQIPFAYRRYKLRQLWYRIQELNNSRSNLETATGYTEYKGVLHVHSSLGGHSKGTLSEIVVAARVNQLDFVVMTEHTESDIDTADLTLKGTQEGILFINGNELSTNNGDRLLVLPGEKSLASAGRQSTADVAVGNRARGSLSVIAYPAEFKSWQANELDGVEVYNTFTNAKKINPLVTFFDVLWSQYSYPDLIFANFYERPNDALNLWDQALQHRRITGVAGNDAHANIGISLDDRSGRRITGIRLDPYAVSFRLVRVHVLVPKETTLSKESLLEAIKLGHCFIGFDVFGDSSGFSFTADSLGETELQGDEVKLVEGLSLRIQTPVNARIRLLRDGALFQEVFGVNTLRVPVTVAGVYRVEVYLPQLGKVGAQPWIISNPIYVR